jgi:hypothetical protein
MSKRKPAPKNMTIVPPLEAQERISREDCESLKGAAMENQTAQQRVQALVAELADAVMVARGTFQRLQRQNVALAEKHGLGERDTVELSTRVIVRRTPAPPAPEPAK